MRLNTLARSFFLPALALAALAACSDSNAPTEKFTGPSGFTLLNPSNPIDITSDGQTVVLEDLMGSLDGNLYFYNVATGALTLETQVGSPFIDFATGVSEGGRVSAVYGDPAVAGVWDQATGWTSIPSFFESGCDVQRGGAWDISADGHTMVGIDWNGCAVQAMRYTETGGVWSTQPLELIGASFPDSPNPPSNRATVVSGNGLVAAGWAQTEIVDRWPAVWQADGSGSLLVSGIGQDSPGEILAINNDGSIMSGTWGGQGFLWRAGETVFIESLTGTDPFAQTYANAIAANGALLFGGSVGKAFVWTEQGSTRSLQQIATDAGIEIPAGVTLNVVTDASADGTIVIGQATDLEYRTYSFILKLPVSYYGL